MDKLTKNLRLMDSRIKDCKARVLFGAGIKVASRQEANELMEKLIERGEYDLVESSTLWEPVIGYTYSIDVWWPDE